MQHGMDNEDEARKCAMDVLDKDHLLEWRMIGNFRDKRLSLSCSPDAVAFDKGIIDKIKFGLEIKCPYVRTLPKSIYEVGADNALQCFVSLYVLGAHVWYLFYWEACTGCYSLFKITRNDEMFEELKKMFCDARFTYLVHEGKIKNNNTTTKRKDIKETFNTLYVDKYKFIEMVE